MAKIYDGFLFFNELELLKCRLEYLYDSVDFFIITESNLTQAGSEKPLYFKENIEQFSKWEDKIIHNVVDFVPNNFQLRSGDPTIDPFLDICSKYNHYPHEIWRYENETFQRECIIRPLIDRCNDDDIILISDLDEFPKREYIKTLNPKDTHINFHNSMRPYYIDVEEVEVDWIGTFGCRWDYLKDYQNGLNGIRMAKRSKGMTIENAGWHLTFLGGPEKIKEKIRAYGHQEFNNDYVLSNVESRMSENLDIFFRHSNRYRDVDISTVSKRTKMTN
jgi:beta-1,4-mannosyl-glycoprotein beta-1,4-N-acetylglucosaminyltransferase